MTRAKDAPETFKGNFNAFPRVVERSAAVVSLSDAAYRLLHNAVDMHTGKNNGHIVLTLAKLSPYGWNSNRKLTAATHELLDRELLVLTRQGGMGLGPSFFALGWLRIHSFAGLDITPKLYRQGAWLDYPNDASPTPGAGAATSPNSPQILHPERVRQSTRSGCETTPGAGATTFLPHPERVREVTNKLMHPHPERVTVTELPVGGSANALEVEEKKAGDVSGMVG